MRWRDGLNVLRSDRLTSRLASYIHVTVPLGQLHVAFLVESCASETRGLPIVAIASVVDNMNEVYYVKFSASCMGYVGALPNAGNFTVNVQSL